MGNLPPARIAKGRSIRDQIAIYRRAVEQAERSEQLRSAELSIEYLRTRLNDFAQSTDTAEPQLLARLASELKQRS